LEVLPSSEAVNTCQQVRKALLGRWGTGEHGGGII